MMKQNPKDQKPVQKTKEGKIYVESTDTAKSVKNQKNGFASAINKNTDNNLVFLYW